VVVEDVRVCFLGDSYVAGAGDPEHLGWVGRVSARADRGGQPLTAYNLGVRRETSRDVTARWRAECVPRLPAGCSGRIVVAFGVNDTTQERGVARVAPADSGAHLAGLLEGVAARGWPALVVGPPPVADAAQNERISVLDARFLGVCQGAQVGYVSVFRPLLGSGDWMREVSAGDGAHPGSAGYAELAELVWPPWWAWLQGSRRSAG
jgi:acyl-CoA thioesterase-1